MPRTSTLFILLVGIAVSGCFVSRSGTAERDGGAAIDAAVLDAGGVDADRVDAGAMDRDAGADAGLDAGAACVAGSRRCVSDTAEECAGSPLAWSFIETCALGCGDMACARMIPRNGVPPELLLPRPGELAELRIRGGDRIDTAEGAIRRPDGSLVASCSEVLQPGARALCVFSAIRIVVEPGLVRVVGDRPLVLAGREEVAVTGVLDAAAEGATAGPGGWMGASIDESVGEGPGAGTGGATSGDHAGGGGAGYSGRGGNSGTGTEGDALPGSSAGGVPYPCTPCSTAIEPFIGGSGGGSAQCGAVGGGGGGAVHLLSGMRVRLTAGAGVDVGGGGGAQGVTCFDAGGGGGSGGAILLEAPTVQVPPGSFLVANGGGGGSSLGSGWPGQRSSVQAFGGPAGASGGGGAGAAGSILDGTSGETRGHSGGGGGGATGRIRIVVQDPAGPAIDAFATVSPATSTRGFVIDPLVIR